VGGLAAIDAFNDAGIFLRDFLPGRRVRQSTMLAVKVNDRLFAHAAEYVVPGLGRKGSFDRAIGAVQAPKLKRKVAQKRCAR
jgi:hypothetical protein